MKYKVGDKFQRINHKTYNEDIDIEIVRIDNNDKYHPYWSDNISQWSESFLDENFIPHSRIIFEQQMKDIINEI